MATWTRSTPTTVICCPNNIGPTAAPAPPPKPVARELEVSIKDFQFQPFEIHIPPGTTVTWKNADDTDHTTTADRDPRGAPPYEWSSPLLRPGDEFSHTFTRPDIYPYHIAQPDSEREGTPQSIAEVRPVVNAMLAHLNLALEGLSSADVRIARSQFRQFFNNREDVGDELSSWYPGSFVSLEAEVERTEGALLHQAPEDTATARAALLALRAGMSDVMRDLNDQADAGP